MDASMNDVGETEYSAPTDSGPGECSRIEVTPTKNGGYAAKCFYKSVDRGPKDRGSSYREPDDYAFSTFDELAQWMRSELGAEQAPAAPAAPPMPAA